MQMCTMQRYRGFYSQGIRKNFKPTALQLSKAKKLYKKLIKLKPEEKLKVSTKQYKDLWKIDGILQALYFPYYDLPSSQTDDGEVVTFIYKGSRVQKALTQNKKIKALVRKIVVYDLDISEEVSQHDAVIRINKYIKDIAEYVDYTKEDEENRDPLVYKNLLIVRNDGICQDYSQSFYLLASECGIKTALTYSDYNEGHQFNAVDIDGVVSYLDCCWNDTLNRDEYLFMDKKTFEESDEYHHIDSVIW